MIRTTSDPEDETPIPSQPNCKPGDQNRFDGKGLLHDFRELTRDEDGIWYRCPRCGASEVD